MSTLYDYDARSFERLPLNAQINLCVEAIGEAEGRDPEYIKHVLTHVSQWLSLYEAAMLWLTVGLDAIW